MRRQHVFTHNGGTERRLPDDWTPQMRADVSRVLDRLDAGTLHVGDVADIDGAAMIVREIVGDPPEAKLTPA